MLAPALLATHLAHLLSKTLASKLLQCRQRAQFAQARRSIRVPARGRRRPSFSSRSLRLCLLGCRPGAAAQATEGGLPLIAQPTSLARGSAIDRLHQASTAAPCFGLPAGCTCFFGVISKIPFDQAASRRHPVGCPRRRLSCCTLVLGAGFPVAL